METAVWADEGGRCPRVTALRQENARLKKVLAERDLEAVTDCMNSEKSHNDCLCENGGLIFKFNETVEELFVTNPNLKTLDIVRFENSYGVWVSQSLSGIKNQAGTQLTFNKQSAAADRYRGG